jgi:hypothetical protein
LPKEIIFNILSELPAEKIAQIATYEVSPTLREKIATILGRAASAKQQIFFDYALALLVQKLRQYGANPALQNSKALKAFIQNASDHGKKRLPKLCMGCRFRA